MEPIVNMSHNLNMLVLRAVVVKQTGPICAPLCKSIFLRHFWQPTDLDFEQSFGSTKQEASLSAPPYARRGGKLPNQDYIDILAPQTNELGTCLESLAQCAKGRAGDVVMNKKKNKKSLDSRWRWCRLRRVGVVDYLLVVIVSSPSESESSCNCGP